MNWHVFRWMFICALATSHNQGQAFLLPITQPCSPRRHSSGRPTNQMCSQPNQERQSIEDNLNSMLEGESIDGNENDWNYDPPLTSATERSASESPSLAVRPKLLKTTSVTGVTPRAGPLNEAVVSVLSVTAGIECTLQRANELIDIGAVWARMETLTQDEMMQLYDRDDASVETGRVMYADLPKGWAAGLDDRGSVKWQLDPSTSVDQDLDEYVEAMQEQRFRRILKPCSIEAGVDLRIYPKPRRFPSCYDMTRETSLLYEDTTFIVVDKPPMLPTQPDASNYAECCPGCVETLLGPFTDIVGEKVTRPLLCHRVDSCVGGCVVLSKDRNGQRVFHELQRERKLRKLYLAVTTNPVPLGMHVHWMWAGQSLRGTTVGPPCQLVRHALPENRRKARTFWNRCVLEVVSCEPIDIASSIRHTYVPISPNIQHYQSTIRLVTGRKHQVRAQLSSLGCPIIRDSLYEPIAGLTLDNVMMDDDGDEASVEGRIAQCRVPNEPIGLQAAGILFGGIKARANAPWWANDSIGNVV